MKDHYGEVSVTRDGHVAILEIDRPPNNFVSVELMRALADALDDVDGETNLRASVVCSAGKAFCAAADLASPTGVGGSGMAGINPLYHEAVRLFSAKKPIVMAVQGAAVGAGLGLALVGDFRVAAPEVTKALRKVAIPFAVSRLAQAAALASLDVADELLRRCAAVVGPARVRFAPTLDFQLVPSTTTTDARSTGRDNQLVRNPPSRLPRA